jgi:putative transposase
MIKKKKLPNRKSLRRKDYNYSTPGGYFVTICCKDQGHRFGKITDGIMHLNPLGRIAHDEWLKLPQRFPHITLKEFVIMQNHMHGIIFINSCSENGDDSLSKPATLGEMIGAYKSLVNHHCHKLFKRHDQVMGKLWHRNYFERIIQDDLAYQRIAAYIVNNPKAWCEKYRSEMNSKLVL